MLSPYFDKLQTSYIFPIIEKKLAQMQRDHPNQKIINLGIGDVAFPLPRAIARTIAEATQEMSERPRGYGPCGGYPFLKEAICKHEYARFGIDPDEIFISDGANADAASIQEIFTDRASALVTDPSYPVYRDATLISGRDVIDLPLREEEGFIPRPPLRRADLAYLCTPSNPTGVAMTHEELAPWIDWAKHNQTLLIIDNVYQPFVTSPNVPASIYELEGGREVAIEIRSFSKWAGFTGLRCGYMVVPKTLHCTRAHELWTKRVEIKTNGIAYPIQRGAEAAYSAQAQQEISEQLAAYRQSGVTLRGMLDQMEQVYFGGIDAPYIFWKTPEKVSSWSFFNTLIDRAKVLAIPGRGFGPSGEGFVRLSCFLPPALAAEAVYAIHHHFCTV